MNGISVAVEILFLIAFLFGVTFGIVLTVSLASRREDSRKSLTSDAPDAACLGARWLVGAGSRGGGGELDR
jgi:hypothetical protein